jgi:DNA-binding beta-propeller fold protein YncE
MTIPLLILLMTFGRFTGAVDLDYDIQGNIYVVDRTGNMVVKLSPQGDSLRALSGFGNGTMQFDTPSAIYARRGNDVYVADYNNHRIQRFNRTLDYITTIYTRDDAREERRFGYPRDLAVSRQGDLLIIDGENSRIVKINASGEFIGAFGTINAGAGRLVEPSKIEVDDEDNVYVLDQERLLQFDPFGSYVRDIPAPFGAPMLSISVDRDTLTILGPSSVSIFDLKTNALVDIYETTDTPLAARLAEGKIVALEQTRALVYAIPGKAEK